MLEILINNDSSQDDKAIKIKYIQSFPSFKTENQIAKMLKLREHYKNCMGRMDGKSFFAS